MSKMSEQHSLAGGTGKSLPQNHKHLQSKSADELLDEFTDYIFSASETNVDVDVIDAYLDVLDEKDPLPFKIDADRMFTEFKEKHSLLFEDAEEECPPRFSRRHRRLPRKIAAVVLAAVLCGSVCAQASGFDIFGVIAQWSQDIFSFKPAEVEHLGTGEPRALSETYTSVQEALDALAIRECVAPTQYPEEYVLDSIESTILANSAKVRAVFKSEDGKEFSFVVRHFASVEDAAKANVEKDNDAVKLHIVGSITHYILNNMETATASWMNNTTLCVLNGDLSEEEIKLIINSIYER